MGEMKKMKITLVSGCSTSLNIDTLDLSVTNVLYVEKQVAAESLASAVNQINAISALVPRPTTSYIVLNLVKTESGKEEDYLLVGRTVGDDTVNIVNKALLRRDVNSYTTVLGKLDIASIDGIKIN